MGGKNKIKNTKSPRVMITSLCRARNVDGPHIERVDSRSLSGTLFVHPKKRRKIYEAPWKKRWVRKCQNQSNDPIEINITLIIIHL